MQLTFLGKNTVNGGSPTLFATDRDSYVVQGWRVPDDESSVEIPQTLLEFLEADTSLDAVLHDTGRASYVLSGAGITDQDALALMDIPGHETVIEVGKVREDGVNGPLDG